MLFVFGGWVLVLLVIRSLFDTYMLSVVVFPLRSYFVLLVLSGGTRIFVGFLVLEEMVKGFRPVRFRVLRDGREQLLQPSEAVLLLRRADEILLASDGYQSDFSSFCDMLSSFQLGWDRVYVCGLCLKDYRFTRLDESDGHGVLFHGRHVCRECARSELVSAIERSGKPLGLGGMRRLLDLLDRFRDFDRVVGLLSPLEADFGLTRFDRIEAVSTPSSVDTGDLPIVDRFKRLLFDGGLKKLLPVQSLAVENGLLAGSSLLVVSATATGKTFVGELAGVENVLRSRGRLLFLVPLVALANQKYRQFKERYRDFGLSVSLRVGVERIRTGRGRSIRTSLSSDIIVGTYEGVDYLIRAGMLDDLGKIGTVVIDEVHMLEDDERGHRIDGLIARLRFLFPSAQFVYLSATVGNPRWLAESLGACLVEYEYRPISLERHLVFALEGEKQRLIERLCREEYEGVSSKGFRGQSIVFTNSRRNCHLIAGRLRIGAAAYHAGLSYDERLKVEERFATGKLPVVVTTAALGAGVDLPASQVIFETLSMGVEELSVQEFNQMLGRAGRPDYHDRGRVVLLADPNRNFRGGGREDEVAFKLLGGEIEHVDVIYDRGAGLEETLANVAASGREEDIVSIDSMLLGFADVQKSLKYLSSNGFIRRKGDRFKLTSFGRIVSSHFLSVSQAFLIRESVLSGEDVLDVVTRILTFDALYFKYARRLSQILKVEVPERVFAGAALDLIFSPDNLSRLDSDLERMVLDFSIEFMACECRDAPFCSCSERRFSEYLIELRCNGLDPTGIIDELSERFGMYAYQGDVITYLENALRIVGSIHLIATIFGREDVAAEAGKIKRCVERGKL